MSKHCSISIRYYLCTMVPSQYFCCAGVFFRSVYFDLSMKLVFMGLDEVVVYFDYSVYAFNVCERGDSVCTKCVFDFTVRDARCFLLSVHLSLRVLMKLDANELCV